jgi:hypothetical protein
MPERFRTDFDNSAPASGERTIINFNEIRPHFTYNPQARAYIVNKFEPNDSDEDPDHTDDIFTKVAKTQVSNRLKDGVQEKHLGSMSEVDIQSARMTKVSYINLTEGTHSAHMYMKQHLPGWSLDTALTNEHGAVFHNKATGELHVAYRGTQTLYDWDTNFRMLVGKEEGGEQVKALEEQLEKIKAKYQKAPDLLTGHSKGGGQAIYMGEKHGINTNTQDPFVPSKHLLGGKANAEHSIVRTPTDWVSAGSNISKYRKGFKQIDIAAAKGSSLLQSHDLNVMTGVEHKGTGNTEYNPEVKQKAFLVKHMREGKSFQEVAEAIGYEKDGADYKALEKQYQQVQSAPDMHEEHLKSAGFSKEPVNPLKSLLKEKGMKAGANLTSTLGKGAYSLANPSTAAGILGALGAAKVLESLGVEDEATYAGVSGAVGDVTADVASNVARRAADKTTAKTATQAMRNLAGDIVEGVFQRISQPQSAAAQAARHTNAFVESAIQRASEPLLQRMPNVVMDVGQATSAEARTLTAEGEAVGAAVRGGGSTLARGAKALGKGVARGGLSGLIAFAVETGVSELLHNVGVEDDIADVIAGTVGGFAGGMVYGPEGAFIGAGVGGGLAMYETTHEEEEPQAPTQQEVAQEAYQETQQDITYGTGDEGQALANMAQQDPANAQRAQITVRRVHNAPRHVNPGLQMAAMHTNANRINQSYGLPSF